MIDFEKIISNIEPTTVDKCGDVQIEVPLKPDDLADILKNYVVDSDEKLDVNKAKNGELYIYVEDLLEPYGECNRDICVACEIDGEVVTVSTCGEFYRCDYVLKLDKDTVTQLCGLAAARCELQAKCYEFVNVDRKALNRLCELSAKSKLEDVGSLQRNDPSITDYEAEFLKRTLNCVRDPITEANVVLKTLQIQMAYGDIENIPQLKIYVCADTACIIEDRDGAVVNIQALDKDGKDIPLLNTPYWLLEHCLPRDVFIPRNEDDVAKMRQKLSRYEAVLEKLSQAEEITIFDLKDATKIGLEVATDKLAAGELLPDNLIRLLEVGRDLKIESSWHCAATLEHNEWFKTWIDGGEKMVALRNELNSNVTARNKFYHHDEFALYNSTVLRTISLLRMRELLDDNRAYSFDDVKAAFNNGEFPLDQYTSVAHLIKASIDDMPESVIFDETTYLRTLAVLNYAIIKEGKEPSKGELKAYDDAKEWAKNLFNGAEKEKTAVKAVHNKDDERNI